MKKFNPLFTTGTVGLIVSATLHIFMALSLALPAVHSIFFTLYAMFGAFLIIGTAQVIAAQKLVKQKVPVSNSRLIK